MEQSTTHTHKIIAQRQNEAINKAFQTVTLRLAPQMQQRTNQCQTNLNCTAKKAL